MSKMSTMEAKLRGEHVDPPKKEPMDRAIRGEQADEPRTEKKPK